MDETERQRPGYSLKIARVQGMDVRVHFLFFAFAWLWWLQAGPWDSPWALPVALFAVSLAHESARAWVAGRAGLRVHSTALWPLGGFRREEGDIDPRSEFRFTLAGMGGSLLVLGLSEAAWAAGERFGIAFPAAWRLAVLQAGVASLAWNFLPAFPLDGARLLRSLLWARGGWLLGTRAACGVSFLTGVFLAAWGFHAALAHGAYHALALAAVLIAQSFIEARRTLEEPEEEEESGWEPSGGVAWRGPSPFPETDLPRPLREGWFRRLGRKARERRHARLRRRVDALLLKVSRTGMEGLSPRERRFLWNASERYRHPEA